MPKGETSRPYTRKEKQAVKSNQALKSSPISQVNKMLVRSSNNKTLLENRMKEKDRNTGAMKGKVGLSQLKKYRTPSQPWGKRVSKRK